MQNKLSNETVNFLSVKSNKLFLLKGLEGVVKEVTLNKENKEFTVNLLVNKFKNDSALKPLNESQQKEVFDTGLTILMNEIKATLINQERKSLAKINILNEQRFLNQVSERLIEIQSITKENIEKVKNLREISNGTSLNDLANKINEYHNPTTKFRISDSEIDNLLEGGEIEI